MFTVAVAAAATTTAPAAVILCFFFCLFFNLISNHSDFQQPGFNTYIYTSLLYGGRRVGIGGVIEGCQQLPYNTPGLTW